MKTLLSLVIAALFTGATVSAQSVGPADDAPATSEVWASISTPESTNLNDFLWVARPVVVFADSPDDPRLIQQLAMLEDRAADLAERDVVVLTDTDPAAKSELRRALRPRGFMLVLIGKDGGVKLRKPFPWDVRELSRVIDKMPMRQREVSERRGSTE